VTGAEPVDEGLEVALSGIRAERHPAVAPRSETGPIVESVHAPPHPDGAAGSRLVPEGVGERLHRGRTGDRIAVAMDEVVQLA